MSCSHDTLVVVAAPCGLLGSDWSRRWLGRLAADVLGHGGRAKLLLLMDDSTCADACTVGRGADAALFAALNCVSATRLVARVRGSTDANRTNAWLATLIGHRNGRKGLLLQSAVQ